MQISTGQDSIQRLIAAEQEAQKIVAAARKARTERLKQAKAEAEKEIKSYKKQREESYQKRISDDSSSSGANAKRLEGEGSNAKKALDKSIASKKQEVLDMLLKYVSTVPDVKIGASV
ncbi:hypothetical protein WJX73_008059 [Symbiochloris irregularis]|uniref:V-type proton ATPase subunit G n=1 Tax=Symbiochloris irregularis TaxID=706552 RepID=A0AAW1NLL9_9CHLO